MVGSIVSAVVSAMKPLLVPEEHKVLSSNSNALIGVTALRILRITNCLQHFLPIVNEPSFMTEAEYEISLTHQYDASERSFNVFITPFLRKIFSDDKFVLVNSEVYPWMTVDTDTSKYDKHCDFFITFEGLYTPCPFPKDDCELLRTPESIFLFGKGIWSLRDFIILIFESKPKISENKDFGELIVYAELMAFKRDSKSPQRAVLIDSFGFWLVIFTNGRAVQVTQVKWIDSGSLTLMRDFLKAQLEVSPWLQLLLTCCSRFNCRICDDGYLGSGKFGKVFRVRYENSDEELALKISTNDDLLAEYEKLFKVDGAAGLTVRVVSDYTFLEGQTGGGFLLSPVGLPVVADTYEEKKEIFEHLFALHRKGISHGDPRRENVIRDVVTKKLLWIDLVGGIVVAVGSNMRTDVLVLVASLYGLSIAGRVSMTESYQKYHDSTIDVCGASIFDLCEHLRTNTIL